MNSVLGLTQNLIMNDKDYYILNKQLKMLKDIRKLVVSTLLLLNVGVMDVIASNNTGAESNVPGFEMIASLITLGIIAFLAPFLKREKADTQ